MYNPIDYLSNPRGPSFPDGGSKTRAYYHIREVREHLRHLEEAIRANDVEKSRIALNELLGLIAATDEALFPSKL